METESTEQGVLAYFKFSHTPSRRANIIIYLYDFSDGPYSTQPKQKLRVIRIDERKFGGNNDYNLLCQSGGCSEIRLGINFKLSQIENKMRQLFIRCALLDCRGKNLRGDRRCLEFIYWRIFGWRNQHFSVENLS